VVWVGRERIGDRDGRVALYLADSLGKLLPPEPEVEVSDRARRIMECLERQGANFFAALHQAAGGGYPGDTQEALWELVWAGRITNDTFQPVRSLVQEKDDRPGRRELRDGPPGSPEFLRRLRGRGEHSSAGQGRWSLVRQRALESVSPTEWSANISQQLLARHGIVMRETALAENVPGGYPSIYPALRKMEESGWLRRGMFVAGLGAAQFAMTSAVDLLRTLRGDPERPETLHLAASDPANPYGAVLPWPREGESHAMARASGASVVLVNGRLAAFLRRRNPAIRTMLPENEPERSIVARATASKLADVAMRRQGRRSGLLISEIDGVVARQHFLARFLEEAGFVATANGYQMRRVAPVLEMSPEPSDEEDEGEEDGA
jgi:ATP-dependent helicase Lhr and Lhr-like helicase